MQVAFLGQLRHRALDRAAGAGDVVLVDDVDVRVVGPCRLGDAVSLIVHDDGQRLGLQLSDRCHDALEEGLAREFVQDLRLGRTHACSLTCGEDDCGG